MKYAISVIAVNKDGKIDYNYFYCGDGIGRKSTSFKSADLPDLPSDVIVFDTKEEAFAVLSELVMKDKDAIFKYTHYSVVPVDNPRWCITIRPSNSPTVYYCREVHGLKVNGDTVLNVVSVSGKNQITYFNTVADAAKHIGNMTITNVVTVGVVLMDNPRYRVKEDA